MDTIQAQLFRDRWRLLASVERQLDRQATFDLRWQQLNTVYRLGHSLPLMPDDPAVVQVVERWRKLKEHAA